ncbi:hypothetical protein [Natronomonas gomsonensis]|uniref:hypothetical protein n=1 Tax=Natronomonas gomsonensis TaxID=1046043 RepID=UPI0015C0922D|nr:hypothetical protein [Natronomonas gomsonensis]
MTEQIKIEVHATTYPNGNTEFNYKHYDDLLTPLKLTETQLNDLYQEVSDNIIVDATNPFSLVAVATFDSDDDTNPDIDYSVRDDSKAPDVIVKNDDKDDDEAEITVVEDDDCIHIDNSDDHPTLDESIEGTDIIVADN